MAQIRNISGDHRMVEHLGRYVEDGEVFEIPDADVLQPDKDGNYVHDDAYADLHPDARNWRVPGVFQVEGDLPPVTAPATKPTPAPAPAPAEAPSE